MLKYKHVLRLVIVSSLVVFGSAAPAAAATTKTNDNTTDIGATQAVAQSYSTASPLQQGLIVQLNAKNKQVVEPATYAASKKMFGVTVASSATAVTLSSDTAGNTAYVVSSGRYSLLVTNQNGAITAGDSISISALSGIGMKSDTTEDSVLGHAVSGFDGKTNAISTTTLKTEKGAQQTVGIGTITVDIGIGANPLKSSGDSGVPKFIQNIATTVVGKPISAPQLYASLAVVLVGVGVVASLMYGGIQTGMTAIGRNPLAKKSIIRSMVQVIIAGLIIFIGCLFAVYLILKI